MGEMLCSVGVLCEVVPVRSPLAQDREEEELHPESSARESNQKMLRK